MFASNNILRELFRVNQDSLSQNRSLGNISKKLKYLVFGSVTRFGFILDEELKEPAACDEVKAALSVKISRKRIGTEIDLMISENQPVQAMAYISDLKLFWVVFSLHMKHEPEVSEGCRQVVNVHYALEKFLFLIPYFASNEDALISDVNWAREAVDVPLASKPWLLTGFLLREIKDFWRVVLLMSTLLYPPNIDCTEDLLSKKFELERQRDLFTAAEDAILKLGYLILLVQTSAVAKGFTLKTTLRLAKVWDVKPLLNGKEIMNVLQLKTGGPLVQEWLARPSGTAEECLDWMRKTHCLKME